MSLNTTKIALDLTIEQYNIELKSRNHVEYNYNYRIDNILSKTI